MVQFSSRMSQLKGSAIRELLALANKPEVLSFAGGMPAPELFPVDKIKAATDAVLEEQGKIALQYSSTNGFEHFRQQIADRMEAKLNIKTSADNILVTSGSQQGLDYSARVFCDKGDVVIIESPSYLGALNAFKACEPNFVAIPTDGDGMIMEDTLFAPLYVGLLISFVILLREAEYGQFFVWLIFISAWGSDTCAYFTGSLIGKHKLAPVLSPKKTVEGAIGGAVGAGLLAVVYTYIYTLFAIPYMRENMLLIVGIVVVSAILSQFGDLAASAIKRTLGVKDFGYIFPGHGGVLDRFDSILFVAPFIVIALQFISEFKMIA